MSKIGCEDKISTHCRQKINGKKFLKSIRLKKKWRQIRIHKSFFKWCVPAFCRGPPKGNINILINFLIESLMIRDGKQKLFSLPSLHHICFKQKSETEGTIDNTDDAHS